MGPSSEGPLGLGAALGHSRRRAEGADGASQGSQANRLTHRAVGRTPAQASVLPWEIQGAMADKPPALSSCQPLWMCGVGATFYSPKAPQATATLEF